MSPSPLRSIVAFTRTAALLWAAVAASTTACTKARGEKSPEASPQEMSANRIDTAHATNELLRRFRAAIPDTPTVFAHGELSREALLDAFRSALLHNDTTALRDMTLSMAEFAYLYYPEDEQAKAPYELSPSFMWMQMSSANEHGARRLLAKYGDTPAAFKNVVCDSATAHGKSRVWNRCTVDGIKIFGAIIERDGRFKFVTLANKLPG